MFGGGWEEITEFAQKTEKTRVYLDDLKKEFIYWFDGGGALTKRVANNLVQRMRNDIYSQRAFEGFPPLTPGWKKAKKSLGYNLDIGIATGDMVNAIQAINMRYRRYKVGISWNQQSISYGNVEKVAQYAKMLEEGWTYEYETTNDEGEVETRTAVQPPRPFFSRTFLRWTKENLPEEIKNTIFDNMQRQLEAIARVVDCPVPPYKPSDVYYVYHNPDDDLGY